MHTQGDTFGMTGRTAQWARSGLGYINHAYGRKNRGSGGGGGDIGHDVITTPVSQGQYADGMGQYADGMALFLSSLLLSVRLHECICLSSIGVHS